MRGPSRHLPCKAWQQGEFRSVGRLDRPYCYPSRISPQRIVALKQAEHLPLLTRKFPSWVDRVEYWHAHDIDFAKPEEALPQIEAAIQNLLNRLVLDTLGHSNLGRMEV